MRSSYFQPFGAEMSVLYVETPWSGALPPHKLPFAVAGTVAAFKGKGGVVKLCFGFAAIYLHHTRVKFLVRAHGVAE